MIYLHYPRRKFPRLTFFLLSQYIMDMSGPLGEIHDIYLFTLEQFACGQMGIWLEPHWCAPPASFLCLHLICLGAAFG